MASSFEITKEEVLSGYTPIKGSLEDLFYSGSERATHKWIHYLPIYERYFSSYKNTKINMLEIGVSFGGSLDLWRRFFGDSATIYGVDVNPECANRVTYPNQVRIGSQADPDFLAAVVAEMGPPNIILDDGSHHAAHQIVSFQTLFPLLQTGGLYVIEDLHTAYWPDYGGGMRKPTTGIELVKALIDDQHGWYHQEPEIWAPKDQIGGIHIYDSIAIIEKVAKAHPSHCISIA